MPRIRYESEVKITETENGFFYRKSNYQWSD